MRNLLLTSSNSEELLSRLKGAPSKLGSIMSYKKEQVKSKSVPCIESQNLNKDTYHLRFILSEGMTALKEVGPKTFGTLAICGTSGLGSGLFVAG